MSMSLDGYIADPNDRLGGDDGNRLHDWFVFTPDGEFVRPSGPAGQLMDEWNATGAVLVGRRTAEQVDHWGGDHHGRGVPIFVPSHRPPGPSVANYPLVTYVADGVASAMDELIISQIPVLFGGGRRLFEVLPSRIELEISRVIDTPEATHIRYRV